ncbi:hypothetical protein K2Z84_07215 [Candidatus Binatia bacterium]|jgi:hypothetical protein|nr:hypothetical protein [Candidatus Binatia bacterium]
MSRPARCVTILLLALGIWSGTAPAADHVVGGTQLRLRRTPAGGTLTLMLRDVAAIPAPGSADDPSTTGMLVTLFGRGSGEEASLSAAPGKGRPGWVVQSAARVTYAYVNADAGPGSSTLQSATLRTGSGLRLRARSAGLDLSGAEGGVAVRVEWGSERVCAVFDGAAIRHDEAGFFLGVKAAVPALPDCDDATLLGATCTDTGGSCGGTCPGDSVCGGNSLIGCSCVSPHQPCGDSAPVCNGECPAGEECSTTTGGPFTTCGCLPVGSMACGDLYESCGGGDCPAGTSCYGFTLSILRYCACASEPPTDPCGGDCPAGWSCVGPVPGMPATCIPPFCGGGSGAPACDGSCDGGVPNDTCTPIGGTCFCVEHCGGGEPYPTCGGTCTSPDASCIAVDGKCLCNG